MAENNRKYVRCLITSFLDHKRKETKNKAVSVLSVETPNFPVIFILFIKFKNI
jgi:hypothetical protein